MKIFVKTKTHAKKEYVEKIDENHYVVAVKEMPTEGRANKAVIEALAEYFKVKRSEVNILSGFKSKQKIIQIGEKRAKIKDI